MTITEKYIHLILPSLSGFDGGEVETYKDNEGMIGYKFPCCFCSKFYGSKDIRLKKHAHIFQTIKFGNSGHSWFFKCMRRGSNECKGGIKSFYNFLLMYYPQLAHEYMIALKQENNWK